MTADTRPTSEGDSPEPVEPVVIDPVIADPAALEAEAARRAEKMARRAHRRRNALRWSAALVVSLVVGGGTAFAISLPQRTDLPGLATPPDGRYDFPELTLPALPAGQAAPSASADSFAQRHLADIRPLLLPRPIGATGGPAKLGFAPFRQVMTLQAELLQ